MPLNVLLVASEAVPLAKTGGLGDMVSAYAAALRILRFHIQNDHGDWDTVHHAFTAANGLHQALQRRPSPELMRGAVHAALRINLDPTSYGSFAEIGAGQEVVRWFLVVGGASGTVA